MIRILACIGAAITVSASSAAAQMVSDIAPGTRVRVSTPGFAPTGQYVIGSGSWTVGEVVRIDEHGVTLDTDGTGDEGAFTIPFSAIRRLEVSQGVIGSRESGMRGARIGGGIGLLSGASVALFLEALPKSFPGDDDPDESLRSGWLKPHTLIAGGAILGAAMGYLTGSTAREQWGPHDSWRFSVGTDGARHEIAFRVR
jgi:hypothetical protein